MLKLATISALLILALLTLLSSSSEHPRADFTYVNPSGIHTLDPARMSWTQDFRIALNIWEGLTTWHPRTLEPTEGAALFPPKISEDSLTYSFTIRDDARWSNGEPVTSHDFVRGWRRGMEPGTATDYTYLLTQHIEGAGDYVQCRNDAVALLTTLRRLQDGRSISGYQARRLATEIDLSYLAPPTQEAPIAEWAAFAGKIHDRPVDWIAPYDQFFEGHVPHAEAVFQAVGLDTPDDQTLIVHLRHPCPYFLDLTAFPIFLPIHAGVEQLRLRFRGAPLTAEGLVVYDPQWTKPDYNAFGYPGLITNGPYAIDEWIFKRRLTLHTNRFYRDAASINCRSIDMVVYDNPNAAIMAYEADDVDFLPSMLVSYDHEIARLARSGERPDFHLCQVMATHFLNFNCAGMTVNGVPNPFIDPRVRRAFALAVDRERIVNSVLRRGDRLATSLVPRDSIPGYTPPDGLSFDPDAARSMLTEAGFTNGFGLPPIEFLYIDRDVQVAQALANIWTRELGANIELRNLETKTFAEAKAKQRFMIARGNWYADYSDPTTFLDCLTTGNGNNDSGYSSARYDELLRRAADARDTSERFRLLSEAEALLVAEDVPIVPILHYAEPIAIKPYIRGLYANARVWVSFKHLVIEK